MCGGCFTQLQQQQHLYMQAPPCTQGATEGASSKGGASKRLLFSFRSGSFRKQPPSSSIPNGAAPHDTQPKSSGHHRRWSSSENTAALLSANGGVVHDAGHAAADAEQGWFRSWRGRGGRPATHDGSTSEHSVSNPFQQAANGTAAEQHPGGGGAHGAVPTLSSSTDGIMSQSPRPPGCLGLLQRPGSGKYSTLAPQGSTGGEEHLLFNGRIWWWHGHVYAYPTRGCYLDIKSAAAQPLVPSQYPQYISKHNTQAYTTTMAALPRKAMPTIIIPLRSNTHRPPAMRLQPPMARRMKMGN